MADVPCQTPRTLVDVEVACFWPMQAPQNQGSHCRFVDEAAKAGVQVNVHAVSTPAMVAAVDAGVRRLVHLLNKDWTSYEASPGRRRDREPRTEQREARLVAPAGVAVADERRPRLILAAFAPRL